MENPGHFSAEINTVRHKVLARTHRTGQIIEERRR